MKKIMSAASQILDVNDIRIGEVLDQLLVRCHEIAAFTLAQREIETVVDSMPCGRGDFGRSRRVSLVAGIADKVSNVDVPDTLADFPTRAVNLFEGLGTPDGITFAS